MQSKIFTANIVMTIPNSARVFYTPMLSQCILVLLFTRCFYLLFFSQKSHTPFVRMHLLRSISKRYDPTKLETSGFVDGVVKKYGGSTAQEAKSMAAMVKKYGPEPLPNRPRTELPIEASTDPLAAEQKSEGAAADANGFSGGDSSAFAAAEDALSEATSRVHERLASTRQRLEERRRARREAAEASAATNSGSVSTPFQEEEEKKGDDDEPTTRMTYASVYASAQKAAAAQKENHEAGKIARAGMRSEVLAKVDDQVKSLFQRDQVEAKEDDNVLIRND